MALLPQLEIVCAVGAGYESGRSGHRPAPGHRGRTLPRRERPRGRRLRDDAAAGRNAAPAAADRFVRAGGWQEQWRVETPTITGKRLGILGLGNIGSRIAQRAARLRHGDRLSQPGGGRRLPLSLFRQSPRARDVGRFPGRRRAGARGRGTSSTRTCSQRSDRKAISSTSGAGRSWIPRP